MAVSSLLVFVWIAVDLIQGTWVFAVVWFLLRWNPEHSSTGAS